MTSARDLRGHVKKKTDIIMSDLNSYLRGEKVEEIKTILQRLGRGGSLPHWYSLLEEGKSMPNLDGKTIGSVIEMILVAVLEKKILSEYLTSNLSINPAKGVDIPDLELGVKSPSKNFCTSEPFFSSYERIIGNYHDNLILLTDYQSAKKRPPPVRIQIIDIVYLEGSEIADKSLCSIAKKHREYLIQKNEALCKKFLQFLVHLNQNSWRGKSLLKLCDNLQQTDDEILSLIDEIENNFYKKEKKALKNNAEPIDSCELKKIIDIKSSNDFQASIINACNDWVIDTHKDFARLPNDNEWQRFKNSKLNGRIGMSFALQWRYNFGAIFRGNT